MFRSVFYFIIGLGLFFFGSCSKKQSLTDYISMELGKSQPGDTVFIPNGIYTDICLELKAKGKENQLIVVMAETPGKVILKGASTLRVAGEFIEVNGLYFCEGYSPKGAVIEYRVGDDVANSCRITNCAIEYYNPIDRSTSYAWIVFYGRNNRFDHNVVLGKQHAEATIVVALDEERNQQNYHRIDHNYFGVRPNYGSNGGETMRIGNSQYAHTSSYTQIEDNYFEHCSGEVEIISIKSADNIIRRNTFYECEGSVVLRHGKRNTVTRNMFIGNGKPHTGGVRIINASQTVTENYFSSLRGNRFRAPLAIMNAVPNSLPNRYHRVEDALVKNNFFIDCSPIELCVGADNERTESPTKTTVAENVFFNPSTKEVFLAYDNLDGIFFSDNKVVSVTATVKRKGFIAAGENEIHLSDYENIPLKSIVGADWYKKSLKKEDTVQENVFTILATQNSLIDAMHKAQDGDKIVLKKSKTYYIDTTLVINKKVQIVADTLLKEKPIVAYNGKYGKLAMFTIADKGSLYLKGIAFSGTQSDGKKSPVSAISPAEVMSGSYSAKIFDCEFFGFQESTTAAFKAAKNTYADTLMFQNCYFHDISGQGIDLAAEKDDVGRYSAEYVLVDKCSFYKVLGTAGKFVSWRY